MKRFILDTILFLSLLTGIIIGYDCYYYYSGNFKMNVNGSEVYNAIRQSKTKHYRKKIMIGDSVGNQLFPSWKDNDSIAYMSCNQAITLAGMYFLVANYIETNKDSLPEEAILLCTPDALCNYMDIFSYQYFLKPFKQSEYAKWTTQLLKERIHEVKFWWSCELPIIRTNNYTTKYSLSPKEYTYLSPLSAEYILKIDSICSVNSISFRMQSVPVNEANMSRLDTLLYKSLRKEELPERLYVPFIESVFYMPSTAYVDHCHFNNIALDTIDRRQFVGKSNRKHKAILLCENEK